MTDSSTHRRTTAENRSEQSSLTQIEGIGKAKQQWLKSVGITNLQVLAEATLEEVEAQLSANGHMASSKDIEGWITQAQDLIAELVPVATENTENATTNIAAESSIGKDNFSEDFARPESMVNATGNTTENAKEIDVETGSTPAQIVEDWQTLSAFTIKFQSQQEAGNVNYRTLVHHFATDREETWSGIEEDNLQSWLRSQLAEVIPSDLSQAAKITDDTSTWVTLDVENLSILQPPSITTAMGLHQPSMTFPRPIKGDLPFSLVLQFSIPEQNVLAKVKKAVFYKVECYALKLQGKESISLGELPTLLFAQANPYTVHMPAISLQQGMYRLQVCLSLQGMQALPAVIEVPILQVV